ncbi:HIRAN domain-containing protein [Novosphingobium sp. 9]|uniref:HIRAN domain-containing protein n=1 Tax=Novosphingobium sp. 9 TaxID=2025349 RepID=UPI0021B5AD88|nr:HIRAN domain-containing protein [Novosphingobium sp. 9]
MFYICSHMGHEMGWSDFSLPAVGEQHDNEDGTSRQDELARCQPGEMLTLAREPENEHDPMAVAVLSCRGVKVGYLRRDRAVWIGSKIDRGFDVRAIVERVKGIQLHGSPLGLVMRVNMDGEEPELRDRG